MTPVAQISIDYATLADFTSTSTRIGPRDQISVNPKIFAQYALRNIDKGTGLGLQDGNYLAYEGGFLTQQSKLNIKYSNFEIKNTSTTSGGNFSALGFSLFQNNININQSFITKHKTLNTAANFAGTANRFDALTVKDFKDFNFYPGMIINWSGSFAKLRAEMPFWRLCAPPDAGTFANNIRVPNLVGYFVPGGQPTDVAPTDTTQNYSTGTTGGHDAMRVTLEQMPRHSHNVQMSSFDADPYLTLNGNKVDSAEFYQGGGGYTPTNSTARVCSWQSQSCACQCRANGWTSCIWGWRGRVTCRWRCCRCSLPTNSRTPVAATNVNAMRADRVGMSTYETRRLDVSSTAAKIDSQTESNKGGTASHENRPLFYTLAYIIYVGVPR
jgi:microcystin-dependent protein